MSTGDGFQVVDGLLRLDEGRLLGRVLLGERVLTARCRGGGGGTRGRGDGGPGGRRAEVVGPGAGAGRRVVRFAARGARLLVGRWRLAGGDGFAQGRVAGARLHLVDAAPVAIET